MSKHLFYQGGFLLTKAYIKIRFLSVVLIYRFLSYKIPDYSYSVFPYLYTKWNSIIRNPSKQNAYASIL